MASDTSGTNWPSAGFENVYAGLWSGSILGSKQTNRKIHLQKQNYFEGRPNGGEVLHNYDQLQGNMLQHNKHLKSKPSTWPQKVKLTQTYQPRANSAFSVKITGMIVGFICKDMPTYSVVCIICYGKWPVLA